MLMLLIRSCAWIPHSNAMLGRKRFRRHIENCSLYAYSVKILAIYFLILICNLVTAESKSANDPRVAQNMTSCITRTPVDVCLILWPI